MVSVDMEVEQGKMADGRAIVFYHDTSTGSILRTTATVVSGSTILAAEICAALVKQGATVLRVDRLGQDDAHAAAVYHGTVAMPEIWDNIANQYTVQTVIHTAGLDPLEPTNPGEVFAQTVAEGVALLRYLQEYPHRVRVIAASHRTAGRPMDSADSLSPLYGENLRQWERQCAIFATQGYVSVMLLRLSQILVGQGPWLTDLWGAHLTAGGAGPACDCLPIEDAVDAFVQAHAVQSAPTPYWAADVLSEQRYCFRGSAMPQDSAGAAGPEDGANAREILQWHPNYDRLQRVIESARAAEGVSS